MQQHQARQLWTRGVDMTKNHVKVRKHKNRGEPSFIPAKPQSPQANVPRPEAPVRVDFPKDGEVINWPGYTFRVSAVADAASVEISINGSSWLTCRQSLGLWWFDWQGYGGGSYQLQARARDGKGGVLLSSFRRFSVTLA
ncbi:MAG: hypothetical protein HY549_01270 [Elusimicrobia bacterium]|nr:hypothetical protein [Elusimicrobiota bacterium]